MCLDPNTVAVTGCQGLTILLDTFSGPNTEDQTPDDDDGCPTVPVITITGYPPLSSASSLNAPRHLTPIPAEDSMIAEFTRYSKMRWSAEEIVALSLQGEPASGLPTPNHLSDRGSS